MREKRPGYWELRVFAGEDSLSGRKHYRTQTYRGTKRQAQSALAVLVTEVDGGVVEPKKCSVTELLDHGWSTSNTSAAPRRRCTAIAASCASSPPGSWRSRWPR